MKAGPVCRTLLWTAKVLVLLALLGLKGQEVLMAAARGAAGTPAAAGVDLAIERVQLLTSGSTGMWKAEASESRFIYIPGSRIRFTVTVLNEGTETAAACLLISNDLPQGWDLQAKPFSVSPGERSDQTITIVTSLDSISGEYDLTLSVSHPAESCRWDNRSWLEITLEESPFPSVSIWYPCRPLLAFPTPETALNGERASLFRAMFSPVNTLAKIGDVFQWVDGHFAKIQGGGAMVAQRSAEEIFEQGILTGCNDWGIVLAAILRSLGCPVVLVDTAGIDWAGEHRAGKQGPYQGHVFLEVFVQGKWVLLDSVSGEYIEDHNIRHPVISIPKTVAGQKGYFAMGKALDHWTVGIRSIDQITARMKEFALTYPLENIVFPQVAIKKF